METDVNIIGRSNTTVPAEMTNKQVSEKFKYGYATTWSNNNNYYTLRSSRGFENFLGYRHTPTGVILVYQAQRDNLMGSTTYNLNGEVSSQIEWSDDAHSSSFTDLEEEMDAIDSKRKNWDIVKMSVKPERRDSFFNLYLLDGNYLFVKGDMSMIFNVDATLQKGCKVIKQITESLSSVKIEASETSIKEMIV